MLLVCVGCVDGRGVLGPLSQAPPIKKVVPKTEEQLKDIEKAISRCFLFSSLCEAQRKEVGGPADGVLYAVEL